jgi:hypothetical protein
VRFLSCGEQAVGANKIRSQSEFRASLDTVAKTSPAPSGNQSQVIRSVTSNFTILTPTKSKILLQSVAALQGNKILNIASLHLNLHLANNFLAVNI